MNEKINKNKNRSNGTLTEQDLKNSLVYFDNLCPYSNTPLNEDDWHLEHIIPVIMGGTTDPWNCIAVCVVHAIYQKVENIYLTGGI